MVGVDPSQGMLDILAARTQLVRPVHASGTSLPFDADSFDLVITVAAMHHIADPDDVRQTLAEMVRVCEALRPGGGLGPQSPQPLLGAADGARSPGRLAEERLIPEAEIVAGLRAAGGQIVISRQLGAVPDFTPPRAMRRRRRARAVFESTPGLRRFAAHNAIVATK